jgi:uncharacterized damage-inducible protein DinB
MDIDELIVSLRAAREQTLATFADLDPARLSEPRSWRGVQATLQFLLGWLAEGDDTRLTWLLETRARLGAAPNVAQTALLTAGAARGRLHGALVGVPVALFDQPPAPDEWSVQRTLGHIVAIDTRYRLAVEHALTRARTGGSGPMRPDEATLPPREGEAEARGTRQEMLTRLAAARDGVDRVIAATPNALLDAPTIWLALEVDLRFRIHRFAAHDREHTIQLRKTLTALGVAQNEPQLLLADAEQARGALEAALRGIPAELIEREPPGGGPSIAAIVAEALADEAALLQSS